MLQRGDHGHRRAERRHLTPRQARRQRTCKSARRGSGRRSRAQPRTTGQRPTMHRARGTAWLESFRTDPGALFGLRATKIGARPAAPTYLLAQSRRRHSPEESRFDPDGVLSLAEPGSHRRALSRRPPGFARPRVLSPPGPGHGRHATLSRTGWLRVAAGPGSRPPRQLSRCAAAGPAARGSDRWTTSPRPDRPG
jgi:hypothetical protein